MMQTSSFVGASQTFSSENGTYSAVVMSPNKGVQVFSS
jgi:hypothetical protein